MKRTGIALSLALMCSACGFGASPQAQTSTATRVTSPDRHIVVRLALDHGQLTYEVDRDGQVLLAPAPLSLRAINQAEEPVTRIEKVRRYAIDDSYAWYGPHSTAAEQGAGLDVRVVNAAGRAEYRVELRAYNNGVAFRMTLPGEGSRVPAETTVLRPPADSTVLSFDPTRSQYEGVYEPAQPAAIPQGRFMAPPVVVELASHAGYLAVTEGRLQDYPGSVLQSDGKGAFALRPGNEVPADGPIKDYEGEAVARRLAVPAALDGTILTPWRIVMIGSTLDDMVNNDIVSDVSDAPDKKLFPDGPRTSWVKPGRAVWNFLDGGPMTLEGARDFSRMAGDLGFNYQVIEDQWEKFGEANLKAFVDESRSRGVGVWIWKNRSDLGTREQREALFNLCNRTGVVGVKIDFFDSEAKSVIDLYQALLRETAEHHLMVDFHGANKPTGEQRTWPNELTREGVEGMEWCCQSMADAPRARHSVTLPFTRFLAGPADYTPVMLDKGMNNTTEANQIASAVVLSSPLLTYSANPEKLLASPAVPLIRAIPSTWDETRVLPMSGIGKLAVFARRKGNTWFLACMNGDSPQTIDIPLHFLSGGKWKSLAAGDVAGQQKAVQLLHGEFSSGDSIYLNLTAGGGYIAQFTQE